MRLVMDAYWWNRGTESLRRSVHGLVTAWVREFPDDELTIVARRSATNSPVPEGVDVYWTRVWPHAVAASLVSSAIAARRRADVVITHNFAPLAGRRRGVLIHDLLFVTHPEWFTKQELAYYRWMAPLARRADVLLSTTCAEGERISANVRGRRVLPVGLGIEHLNDRAEAMVDSVRPGGFLLAVGRLNARKNLGAAIEGAVRSGLLSPDLPLLIVGEADGRRAQWDPSVEREVERGAVRFLGFVDDGTLRWLTRNCLALVCVSLGEGFGLPPVEAAAVGTPVIVSDLPVFRENLGDVAIFVDQRDPEAIAAAVRQVSVGSRIAEVDQIALRDRHSWTRSVHRMRAALIGAGVSNA